MPPPIHYAKSGDLNIAYQVTGSGPPDLIWCGGQYSHLDLLWESPHFARTFERLGERSRFIIFDKRGQGLSDRPDRIQTLEERMDDIRAVLDAAGSTRSYLLGFSEGGAMAALFAATYPERVSGLVMYGAPVAYGRRPDYPYGSTDEEFDASWAKARANGYEDDYTTPSWRRWLGAGLRDDPAFIEWWRRLRRAVGSPTQRYQHAQMNRLIDIRAVLPSIHVPSLVMTREDDPVCPVGVAQWTAEHIPGARLIVLPGQGHLMFDVWEQWIAAVEDLLTGTTRALPTERFLTTLVSADIVGSTELIAQIGDAR
ncbi:MAG: alpha/beta hydrolase [Chloroflexota bacterium]